MSRAEPREKPGLTLQAPRRTIGPYEEWTARTFGRPDLPEFMVARRPHPDRADMALLGQRLKLGSERAQYVEHHLTVQCFGFLEPEPKHVVQVLEWSAGPDLETLMAAAQGQHRLAPAAAVWLARQILDAVAHAHGLGLVHGVLSPPHIRIEPSGAAKVDFSLSVGRGLDVRATDSLDLRYAQASAASPTPEPFTDIYAVGAILHDLLTGMTPLASSDRGAFRDHLAGLPEALTAAVLFALETNVDARHLGARLDHVFYAVLEADDQVDGQAQVQRWLRDNGLGPSTATSASVREPLDDDSATTAPPEVPTVTVEGVFTRAMRARREPVAPQDFSPEDYVTAGPGERWPDADERELATVARAPHLPSSEDPTEPRTQGLRDEPPPAGRASPRPSLGPPAAVAASTVHPTPSAALWMVLGFALTFFVILIWSWFTPGGR